MSVAADAKDQQSIHMKRNQFGRHKTKPIKDIFYRCNRRPLRGTGVNVSLNEPPFALDLLID